jgi:hypothetical protein
MVDSSSVRSVVLGSMASKAFTMGASTQTLFTVSGLVLVTGIVGKVTTSFTVANTLKLVANPTTGTSSDLCAATDIGTTDTPAGNLLGITGAPTEDMITGVGAVQLFPAGDVTVTVGGAKGIFVDDGVIQAVGTGTSPDGAATWYLTYVAISDGASVSAA